MSSYDEKHLATSFPAAAASESSSTENLSRSPAPPAVTLTNEKEDAFDLHNHDFDPCHTANPCSPFYNHDTPRASAEKGRSIHSQHVAVQDLEAQNTLTPAQTQVPHPTSGNSSTLKPWTPRLGIFSKQNSPRGSQSKTRSCSCMSTLSKRNRVLIKIVIALTIVGTMVGIGVGISLRVGGEVYKDEHTTSKIGNV